MASSGPLFLSYNHADKAAVLDIEEALRARGITAFTDQNDLAAGLPWPQALDRGLRSAAAVAAFVGPHGIDGWQAREIYFALDRQVELAKLGDDLPVVPVLLPGADPSLVPGFLRLNTWVDLRAEVDRAQGLTALATSVSTGVLPETRDVTPGVCPYRGLSPFGPEDAGFYFGRDAFVERVHAKILQRSVVAVVGPSGSGKSSVVMAGVLPRLRRARPPSPCWASIEFTPGKNPWRTMADALIELLPEDDVSALAKDLSAGQGSMESAFRRSLKVTETERLLVVLDQAEELLTLTPAEQRVPFLEALLDAAVAPTGATEASSVHLVLTLRADFYSPAIQLSRRLSDLLQEGLVNLGPLRREEIVEVIQRPARAVGLEFEPGLADAILDDVSKQPGNLPLLEYALTSLWNGREGKRLTHDAYRRIGRVAGSIASEADELLESLAGPRVRVWQLMSRLVRVPSISEEGNDARRRASRNELSGAQWEIALRFADPERRLLVISHDRDTGQDTVEVAHEALIRDWSKLQEWIDQNRDFLRWRQRLELYRVPWERNDGKGRASLLQGPLLQEAERFSRTHRAFLSPTEETFVRESRRTVARGRLVKRAMAVAGAVLLAASLGALGYTRTDHYQVVRILLDASDERAEHSSFDAHLRKASGMVGMPVGEHRTTPHPRSLDDRLDAYAAKSRPWFDTVYDDENLAGLVLAGRADDALRHAAGERAYRPACRLADLGILEKRLGNVESAARFLDAAELSASEPDDWACVADAASCLENESVAGRAIRKLDSLLAQDASVAHDASVRIVKSGALEIAERWSPEEQLGAIRWGVVELAREGRFDSVAALAETLDFEGYGDLVAWPPYSAALVAVHALVDGGLVGHAERVARDYDAAFGPSSLTNELVTAYLEVGDAENAVRLIGGDPSRIPVDLETKAMESLVQQGRLEWAVEFQRERSYGSPDARAVLVAEWIRRGEPERARALARELDPPDGTVALALAWVRQGKLVDAVKLLGPLDEYENARRLGLILRVAAAGGQLDAALDVWDGLPAKHRDRGTRAHLIGGLIRSGQVGRAERLAATRGSAASSSSGALLDVVESLALEFSLDDVDLIREMLVELERAGKTNEVSWFLSTLRRELEPRYSPLSRSRPGAVLAALLAEFGRLRDARLVSESCVNVDDKHFGYAAVLVAYASERHPELGENLERVSFPTTPAQLDPSD